MSVGGRVAWVRDLGNEIEIATWQEEYPGDAFTAIRVEYSDRALNGVSPGDTVWWQGRIAYWTPKGGARDGARDVPMTRIGNSYTVSEREA